MTCAWCGQPIQPPKTRFCTARCRNALHYAPHHKGGKPRPPRRWETTIEFNPEGCWNWTGPRYGRGELKYARIFVDGATQQAHRAFYEAFVAPIPDGLQLDHLCRNTACVNPSHLEPVTNTENQRRGIRTKLTRADVEDILTRPDERLAELAGEFDVSESLISRIRLGKAWRDVPRPANKAVLGDD